MREETLFHEALAKPAAERAVFLAQACAGQSELRAAVEGLLAAHERSGNVLDQPPPALGETVDSQPGPSAPADSPRVPDPLRTTDPVAGAVSTDASPCAADAAGSDLPVVPGYRVLREIARGGMGRVLAAYDLGLDRDVALKILLPRANADRFVRESKITARLPHPGIPPVHALGTLADGSPFLAMKLIAGQTLADEMKTADRPRLLQVFVQVCQAVGFAHSRGVVHRDLKPSNVMVGAFGEVQVMDWGLAKDIAQARRERQRAEEEAPPATDTGTGPEQTTDYRAGGESTAERTQAGTVLGTPSYMAPEQARGEAAGARADVFALGGILCALLTGQPPFAGTTARDVIRRAGATDLAEALARLDGCGADVELVRLCRRCLSPDPAERPADGQAVADGLSAYLNGVQERLHAAERERAVALAREAEQRKRHKVQLALSAAVLALLLGGGTFAWWWNAQAQAGREFDARNAEAVAALLGQAEEALQVPDAAKAALALEAAQKRFAEGGAEQEAQRLRGREADLKLVGDLDKVDQFRWTPSDNKFPVPAVVKTQTRDALARFGADPDAVSVDDAAARVSASVVGQRIVSALDRLLWLGKSAGVRALLRRVDADPYRDAVRDAVLAIGAANDAAGETAAAKLVAVKKAAAKLAELAGRPAALEQPPGFVAFLGEIPVIPVEQRRHLLATALGRRPRELGLLMTLGETYPINQADGANERLRWYQAAVAAFPAMPATHNSLGIALRDKKDPAGAEAAFRKAFALDSHYVLAYSNLGVALADKGQVDEAIACWRKAIEVNPKLAGVHNNLGNALDAKGQVDEAIACFHKAIEVDPKLAKAHANLGKALKDKGQVDEAIACYQKVIQLDPKNALAHTSLGDALKDKGQVDEAIACCRKAIELDPKLAGAHNNLGNALDAKGQVDEAIACYHKAIELDPSFALAHNNLGTTLAEKGQREEAIACLRKAIEADPKLAGAHTNLGTMLRDKGQVDEAIACFHKAIELDPKYASAHTNLGFALHGKGQVDEAIVCFRKAVALAPKLAKAHTNLGNVLEAKGQVDEAIACYRKAIALDPKLAKAHDTLGNALMHKGQLDEAIACYRKAIALDPKLAITHNGLGNALADKGQVDEAIACYHKAIALDPKYAQAHYNLGTALEENGRLDEAIATYKKAIELKPNYAEAHCNLGRALGGQGRFAESLSAYQRGHELGTKQPGWRYPSADWVRHAERRAAPGKLVGPLHEVGQGLKLRGQLDDQLPSLVYQVKLAAGKTYVIDMASPDQKALDPFLVLSDAAGKTLAADDDSGGGLNARIIFRAEQDGTYRIRATYSAFNASSGAFTLTVREQPMQPRKEKD